MSSKQDSLGDRMKTFYEDRTRMFVPRRTYTIIRVDGKAFHTYTKVLEKPFDIQFINDMDETACYMCKNIQGAKFAFVQSDEISILLTDFETLTTDAWFDGNVQKIVSVSSSLATAKFNQLRLQAIQRKETNDCFGIISKSTLAMFDSRVFTIPSDIEVENYFIWRQQDTVRNSIQSVAYNLYSPKEVYGKNTDQLQEMCFQKGVNWNDFDPKLKRGRIIVKEQYVKEGAARTKWISIEPPIFTQNREFLSNLIPKLR